MADLILKKHGAVANGMMSQEPDGRWRVSFLVRDFEKDIKQERGPEIVSSEARAREWVIQQGRRHGFNSVDYDIEVERSK